MSNIPILKMNAELAAERLDGYLVAVSSLKDDGTIFRVFHLGEMHAEKSLLALCNSLKIPSKEIRFMPPVETTPSGIPTLLRNWILFRWNMFNPENHCELDARLFDGFATELDDLLGSQNQWLQVGRGANSQPLMELGAIWDLFIFSVDSGSYAIHCSWDS